MTGTGSRVAGTGSDRKCEAHVISGGKPLTSWKKWIAGSGDWKSRNLEWETADQSGKWVAGSGWGKPLTTAGLESKVQFRHRGEV